MKVKEQPIEEIKRLRQEVAKLRQEKTERKKAEAARREGDARYHALFDRTLYCVYVHDFEGRFLDANDAALNLMGYTREELLSLNISSLLTEDQLPTALKTLEEIQQTGRQKGTNEFRLRTKDGNYVWVETEACLVYRGEEPYAIQGIARDMTEHKKAQETLQESEEQYRNLFQTATDGIVTLDVTGRVTSCNKKTEEICGYKQEELIGKHFTALLPEKEAPRMSKGFQRVLEGKTTTYQTEIKTKSGDLVRVEVTTAALRRDAEVIGALEMMRDITERKQAEEARKESEEKYRTQFETAMDAIVIADAETGILLDCNRAACRLVGRKKSEIVGQHQRILHPLQEMEGELTTTFKQHLAEKEGKTLETQVITKNGEIKEVAIKANIIEFSGKKLVQGIFRDITERKQAEEELRRSEEKYRTILENITDGYYELDLAGNLAFFNDSLCQTLGYTRDELLGMNNRQYMDEENAAKAYQIFNEVYRTGKPCTRVVWEVIRKDSTKLSISSSVSLIRDSQGKPIGFRGLSRDITKQERAEEELRRSEEKYRTILENTVEGYYEADLAGNFTFVNDSICANLGYSRDEMLGMNNRDYMDKQNANKVLERFAEVYTTGQPARGFDFEVIRKDGTKLFISTSVSLIRDSKGEPTGFRGVVRNTTEQKQAEEKLQASEERYRNLFENATDGIFTLDLKTRFTSGNKKAQEMCGYNKDELIGQYATVILPEEEVSRMADAFKRVLKGEINTYDTKIITKNGDLIPVEVTSSPIEVDGEIVGTMGMARDITERKRWEEMLRQSEKKYRTILENITDGYYEVDPAGNFTFFNDSLCKILGYSKNEMIGMNNRQYMDKENARKVYQAFNKVYTTGKPAEGFDWELTRKDGTKRIVEASISLIRNPEGEPIGLRGIVRDITEHKRWEEALRRSEEKYRTILESIEDGYYELDLAGNFTFFNDSMCKILGYPRNEMMGMNDRQYTDKENARKVYQAFNKVYTTGKPTVGIDWETITKDGTKRFIESSASLIRDARGEPIGFRGVGRDVTERKQAEKALQEAKTRFEDLFESANELIITTDTEGWILHVNKEVERFSGYSKKELIGQSILKIAYPEDTPKYIQFWKDILDGLTPRYHLRGFSKTGNISHLLASASVVKKDGKIVEIQYNAKDITEEKQGEEMLRQSEEKYRNILENITDGYYELDLAGNFTFFNDSTCKILGYPRNKLLGMNNRNYMDKENARKVYKAFNKVYTTGKPTVEIDWEVIRKDGTKGFIESSASLIRDARGEPIGFRGVARDTTERKQMEAERNELEKKAQLATRLGVIGEMASGIVHEVNNPLTSVIGFAEMLAQKDLPEDAKEYVRIINSEGKRVASIASRLLNFSRHQNLGTEHTDINKLIEATLELQQYEMTSGNIKITTKLDPHLPRTMADPGQMQQVFLNIMLNAWTAMRLAHGGGKLLIKTKAMDNTIQISFKDDGPGIAKKNLQRIFDPFFTTRKSGEGTGLGLSICQNIIATHDGTIYARSKLGKGATFIIKLPVVARQRKTARNGGANHINGNPWR